MGGGQLGDLVGLGLSVEPGRACYIPVVVGEGGEGAGNASGAGERLAAGDVLEALRGVLEHAAVLKVRSYAVPCAALYAVPSQAAARRVDHLHWSASWSRPTLEHGVLMKPHAAAPAAQCRQQPRR
jgi:hypothetical protein